MLVLVRQIATHAHSPSFASQNKLLIKLERHLGFFLVFFNVLCFLYLICSFRTNCVLVWILFTVVVGVGLLIAFYFKLAMQETAIAQKLQVVSLSLPCWRAVGV